MTATLTEEDAIAKVTELYGEDTLGVIEVEGTHPTPFPSVSAPNYQRS